MAETSITPRPGVQLGLWTADHALAQACARQGLDRLGIDLEGSLAGDSKAARQACGEGHWFSNHRLQDLQAYQAWHPHGLFARSSEVGPGWAAQAEQLLQAGARWLLLPNVHHLAQVQTAVDHLRGRARVVPMVENREALRMLPALIASGLCDEVYFGPNDLSRALALPSRFHAMLHPQVLAALAQCRAAGLPFGIGGAAAPQTPGLPVPAALVLCWLASVGASRLLLGRSFVHSVLADTAAQAADAPGTDTTTDVTTNAPTPLERQVGRQLAQIRACLHAAPLGHAAQDEAALAQASQDLRQALRQAWPATALITG